MNNNGVLPLLLLRFNQRRCFIIAGGLYIALWCTLSLMYPWPNIGALGGSLWFPVAGLRFFLLLAFGRVGVFLELITVIAHSTLLHRLDLSGGPFPFWEAQQMLAVFASAAVILPLRHWAKDCRDFTHPGYSILFLITALGTSTLTALLNMSWLIDAGSANPIREPELFLSRFIGDFIGTITITPLLLVRVRSGLNYYLQQHHEYQSYPLTIINDYADLNTTLITALALLLAFGIPWGLGLNPPLPLIVLLLLLPLAWVALRYSLRGAVLSVVLLDSGLALLLMLFNPSDNTLHYQWVMIAIVLTGLLLGGAVEARNRLIMRYQDFASVSNDLLWEIDAKGRLVEASGRLAKHIALMPGQHWRVLLGEGSQPHLAALEQALKQQQPFHHLEIALHSAKEGLRWIQLNGLPLLNESDDLIGYRGTAIDVTRQRRAEALLSSYNEDLIREVSERTRILHQTNNELALKERHLQVLLAAAPVGVLELDNTQCCRYLNANGCTLTGCTPEQAQGRHILEFVHPDDRDYVEFIWQINRQSDEVQWLEFRLNRTNLWCAAHWINLSSANSDADHALDGAIMVLTNATARRQQDERLWTLAHHDTLTDLPNRSLFWDRLSQALRRAKRRESGAAVLWIDLDGFKAVNDHFGHAAGDALLQQVAQRLKKRMRDSDTVARMGGDEFAVILPDIGESESESVVRVALELVAGLAEPFDLPQGMAQISGSIGVALYPQHAETAEVLTQCADMAMYTAKHAGKNQVHVWQEESS